MLILLVLVPAASSVRDDDIMLLKHIDGGRNYAIKTPQGEVAHNTTHNTTTAEDGEHGGHGGDGDHEGNHPHIALLFPFAVATVGSLVMHTISRVPTLHVLPYTVALFLIGIAVGHAHYHVALGENMSQSIDMWLNVDPHLLLASFLPALLFGDAMGLNYEDCKRAGMQIIILAGPGVLVGTGFCYYLARNVFPYGWSFSESAVFSSILAATDPVAVVALLKELGASRMLTIQISGEALANDGTAIVLWTVFHDGLVGINHTTEQIVKKFARLALGGPLFGLIIGFVVLWLMAKAADKLVHSDHITQLSLTICAAYLVFFFSEFDLEVSGVLATTAVAVVLAKSAWPFMCNPTGITEVWHTLEFFGNTILFTLTGAVFYQSTLKVVKEDVTWLFILFLALIVIRAVMIAILYPFLILVADGKAAQMTWRECAVMTWGGLRGAVGLALALSTRKTLAEMGQGHTGDLMVFFVGGVAGLTLIINATTCAPLMKALGLSSRTAARKRYIQSLERNLRSQGRRFVESQLERKVFSCVGVGALDEYVFAQHSHSDKEEEEHGEEQELKNEIELVRAKQKAAWMQDSYWWFGSKPITETYAARTKLDGSVEELKEARKLFFTMLRGVYARQLKNNYLPQHSQGAQNLPASVDVAADVCDSEGLHDWDVLRQYMIEDPRQRWFPVFNPVPYEEYAPVRTAEGLTLDLLTVVVYIDAHHEVCQRLLEDKSAVGLDARLDIVKESCDELLKARKFLQENKIGVPEIGFVRTKQLAISTIMHQVETISEWAALGVVSEIEAHELLHPVHGALHRIQLLTISEIQRLTSANDGR